MKSIIKNKFLFFFLIIFVLAFGAFLFIADNAFAQTDSCNTVALKWDPAYTDGSPPTRSCVTDGSAFIFCYNGSQCIRDSGDVLYDDHGEYCGRKSTCSPVSGVCSATHYGCSVGTSTNNVSGATTYTWNCTGFYQGSTASCSEVKEVPPPATTYTVRATVYENIGGSVTPNTRTGVEPNAKTTFTLNPSDGFDKSEEVGTTPGCELGDIVNAWSGNTYTTGKINANCTYTFNFMELSGPPPVIVPVCGPTTNNPCDVGTFRDTTDTTTDYKWSCDGSNGATVACTEPKGDDPVNGDCSPNHYLCDAGTSANNAEYVYDYGWTCLGLNGGTNASCTQSKSVGPIDGECAPTHYNCDSGTSYNQVDRATSWTWMCSGTGAGSYPQSCVENKRPDLTASAATPSSAAVDTAQTFSSTISNIGTATTGASFSNFFQVATAANGGGTITNLTSTSMTALATGANSVTTKSYTFTSVGTYSVRACADKTNATSTGVITESNEGNNCGGWTTVTVSVLQPDLTASAATPTSAAVDTAQIFSSTISNIGTATTGASFSNFFQVATAANGGGTITDLASTSMSALNAGTTGVATKSYTFSSAGTYSVRACADKTNSTSTGVITESNESNNCGGWTTVTVSGPGGSSIGVDSVTISAPTVKTDGTYYNVTVVSHKKSDGSVIYNQYALINMGGTNAGAHRGFISWYRGDAWPTAQDRQACSGVGGYAVIQNQAPNDVYGQQYIHLDSCNVTDNATDGTNTAIFTVHFTPLFTSPASNNDISGLTCDDATCTSWINFDINFGLDIAGTGVGGVCKAAHYGCVTGDSTVNVNGPSAWTWKCVGSGSNPTATCTEVKPIPTYEEN